MVDVTVGDGPDNNWHLHETLLCEASSFFKAAVQGAFREEREKKVHLPEEGNHIFALFVQWLYSGDFATQDMDVLLCTYTFGDRLYAPQFTKIVLSKVFTVAKWTTFTPKQAVYVSRNTTESCALRRLVVDTIAYAILSGLQYSLDQWTSMKQLHTELFSAVNELTARNAPGGIFNPMPLSKYID